MSAAMLVVALHYSYAQSCAGLWFDIFSPFTLYRAQVSSSEWHASNSWLLIVIHHCVR